MSGVRRSTLDAWTAGRIGSAGPVPTREELDAWRLLALRHLPDRARRDSPFYRVRLAPVPTGAVRELGDVARLPFTEARDIREHGKEMLCVSQDKVVRVVTLQSSGTTGPPKRLFFSRDDLDATLGFFRHGMLGLVEPGSKVLVFLPGTTPDSVGDLLAQALAEAGVDRRVHGLVTDAAEGARAVDAYRPDCVVGFPVQIRAVAGLARHSAPTVLLCSDYVSASLAKGLEERWSCRVFSHYGSVETGLGGGVECEALSGAHLREADLLLEIVEPGSDRVLEPGEWGEIVVTTLTREAMPLVRYRTGDKGRLLPGGCACGSLLARLDKVPGRFEAMPRLASGRTLGLDRLDEALFSLPGVMDYKAVLEHDQGRERLGLTLALFPGSGDCSDEAASLLAALPEPADADIGPVQAVAGLKGPFTPGKRTIQDRRSEPCAT